MTVAICISCGAFKFGAFNPCEKCGTLPETEDDYAVSFVLTDHFSDKAALEEIGRQIAGGVRSRLTPDSLPPEMLKMILEQARFAKAGCERMAARAKDEQRPAENPPDPQ